ncbi:MULTISPECIES: hypothetical protein [unclassified Ensifer]|uniref:hypothetical protein n=1 Tax=unclassified Ensifer TaxID=2633371 RepID=UPI000712CE81|nr:MULTISPECIES: hypothetical protein [unclassified Ensifer]KQX58631.1 hypothetical protein ASD49_21560 [Ensifer sp. Root1298]KQX88247.1 hypothetical protein ASD41_28860 [Ensifer sp. Root1312]KRC20501.1 hypothetical protein ASE29_31395 [Ensifer sp. Root74]KRD64597.1 hypothetical protein ASE71_31110 [Ensifer sp. Root954]
METFQISFNDVDEAESNLLAQDLENTLEAVLPEGAVTRKKRNSKTQDFGGTLVLVLGTPVAIIAAKAIHEFLVRNSGASIEISKDGDIVARNLASADAAKIAEALARKS